MRIEDVNTFWTDKTDFDNAERLYYEGINSSILDLSVSWFHQKLSSVKEKEVGVKEIVALGVLPILASNMLIAQASTYKFNVNGKST